MVALLAGWDHRWSLASTETSIAVFWADALWERVAAATGVPLAPIQQALMAQASDAEKLAALDAAITRLKADFGSWRVPWGEINRFQSLDGAIVRTFDDAKPSVPVPFVSANWGSLASFGAQRYPGTRRFGEKPDGLFVYTEDGHVIIQIANPANPNCIAPSKKSGPGRKDDLALPVCSPDQMRILLDGTVAYWGTYSVDAAAGEVIHHVTADLSNGYIATDQRRPFRLSGDRLEIGDGKTWTRVLQRAVR